jgi:hypothetical protein
MDRHQRVDTRCRIRAEAHDEAAVAVTTDVEVEVMDLLMVPAAEQHSVVHAGGSAA